MASSNIGAQERGFRDVFERIAYGQATASTGAIASGAQATVAVTVTGVAAPTVAGSNANTWVPIAVWCSDTSHAYWLDAFVSAANTVTVIIGNNTGGSLTPAANSVFSVIMGRVNQRFTQP